MNYLYRYPVPYYWPPVVHHIVCQHQVEIEVWPAEVEVYFQDERHVDPLNTQVRFDAVVYNAPSGKVDWSVQRVDGGPGAGSIDPTGLYFAPPKGALPHGTTDIVVATAADDPLRKAFARVSLVGEGPEPPAEPKLEIYPRQVYLYYRYNQLAGQYNEYIDESNKMQLFRALIRNSDSTQVNWKVDGGVAPGAGNEPWYLYKAPDFGSTREVTIEASLQADPGIQSEARVIQINYRWPDITV